MKNKMNSTFMLEISDKHLSRAKKIPILDMVLIEGIYKELTYQPGSQEPTMWIDEAEDITEAEFKECDRLLRGEK